MQEKRKGPDKQPDSLQMNTPQDRTSLMPLPHQVDHHPYVVILSIMYVGRTLHYDWWIMNPIRYEKEWTKKKRKKITWNPSTLHCPRLSQSSNGGTRQTKTGGFGQYRPKALRNEPRLAVDFAQWEILQSQEWSCELSSLDLPIPGASAKAPNSKPDAFFSKWELSRLR